MSSPKTFMSVTDELKYLRKRIAELEEDLLMEQDNSNRMGETILRQEREIFELRNKNTTNCDFCGREMISLCYVCENDD